MAVLLKNNWLRRGVVLLFWLLVWQLLSVVVNSEILLSDPVETAQVLVEKMSDPCFWIAIGHSFEHILTGFISAIVCSLLLGFLAWHISMLAEFINPAITFIKSVPIVCFIVLLLIWFGAENVTQVAVFLVAFPAFYFACLEGLKNRNKQMSELIKVFNLPFNERILVFHWPSMRPFIQATSKIAVGMSWKSGIAAELIGLPTDSIGTSIYHAKITLSSAEIFAWTFVLVSIAVVCEKLFLLLLEHSEGIGWKLALRATPRSEPAHGAAREVQVAKVSKNFDDRQIIFDLDVTLVSGSRLALYSPSGAGKTTTLRLLAGLEKPDLGHITNDNRVAIVFQEPCLFESRNAIENVHIFCCQYRSTVEVRQALEKVLPAHSLDKPVKELSGGMRRRVELIRTLLSRAELILLDEPFSGLDSKTLEQVYKVTNELLKDRTLVIATHAREDITALKAQEFEQHIS